MRQTYEQTLHAVEEEGLIAILRGIPPEQCGRAAEALYDGGVRLLEVTFDGEGAADCAATLEKLRLLVRQTEGRMQVGAGTVTTAEQLEAAAAAGARFIISPNTNEDLIRRTKDLGLVSIPGAMTPSEIITARQAGADFVKLFPAASLGTGYLNAVRAPVGAIRILAVGGMDVDNLESFLDAGAVGAGIGGCLVNRKLTSAGEYRKITEKAAAFTERMRRYRAHKSSAG